MVGIYAGEPYTEEAMQEIKRENCRTHGQRQQDAHDAHQACMIVFGIIAGIMAALYLFVPVLESALLH